MGWSFREIVNNHEMLKKKKSFAAVPHKQLHREWGFWEGRHIVSLRELLVLSLEHGLKSAFLGTGLLAM